jgi:AMMECR1 domain-containing protein
MVIYKLNIPEILSNACAKAGFDPLCWQNLSLKELIASRSKLEKTSRNL